ncbi:O-antigen ligase family protein [Salinarimonas sp.]|uniref:O-antigen ligase family protein n=1 Tax=Salinarimonas sp. TaxID=2766526 RepID=UPI0032D8B8CA
MLDPFALIARLEPLFWIAFVLAVSGGLALPLGTGFGERVFWLGGDLLALGIVALSPMLYATLIWRNLHLFSWPLLAMLSALWSLTPGLSAYHGAQLLMTMLVGLVLRRRFGLIGLAKLVFVALAVAMALSFLSVAAGLPGTRNYAGEWKGVFSHKNTLGSAMVVLAYTAGALSWAGWRPWISGGVAVLAVVALAASGSGAATVAFVAVLAVAPLLVGIRLGAHPTLLVATCGLSLAALAGIAFVVAGTDPYTVALDALGKDRTLTGRTLLWQFGLASFAENPILGIGYKAYWDSPATTSAYLIYWFGQAIWTFHNNAIEVAVAFGSVGLALFAIGLAVSAVIAVARFLTSRRAEDAWALMAMTHILVVALAETPLFYNHSLYQMLFVALGAHLAGSRVAAPSAGRVSSRPARGLAP